MTATKACSDPTKLISPTSRFNLTKRPPLHLTSRTNRNLRNHFTTSKSKSAQREKPKKSIRRKCTTKIPENPHHDKKRRNIPNAVLGVGRTASRATARSNSVQSEPGPDAQPRDLFEPVRTGLNHFERSDAWQTVSVETRSAHGIHPGKSRARVGLSRDRGGTSHAFRPAHGTGQHLFVRESPRTPPASVLFTAECAARCRARQAGTVRATSIHASAIRTQRLAVL